MGLCVLQMYTNSLFIHCNNYVTSDFFNAPKWNFNAILSDISKQLSIYLLNPFSLLSFLHLHVVSNTLFFHSPDASHLCPFPFIFHPCVNHVPHFKPYLSLSFPNSLLLFLLSPSHPTSLSLSPSPSKQRLADGFPITVGTEGPGWLPHVNVGALALNISSTQRGGDGELEKYGDEAMSKWHGQQQKRDILRISIPMTQISLFHTHSFATSYTYCEVMFTAWPQLLPAAKMMIVRSGPKLNGSKGEPSVFASFRPTQLSFSFHIK